MFLPGYSQHGNTQSSSLSMLAGDYLAFQRMRKYWIVVVHWSTLSSFSCLAKKHHCWWILQKVSFWTPALELIVLSNGYPCQEKLHSGGYGHWESPEVSSSLAQTTLSFSA